MGKTRTPRPQRVRAAKAPGEAKALTTTRAPRKAKATETKGPTIEHLGKIETMTVPSSLILAAEALSNKSEETRHYLQGVYMHRHDDATVRLVGTDGHRMFIGSFEPEGGVPSWVTTKGLIISNEGLKTFVGMITKLQESPTVQLSHARGNHTLSLSDKKNLAVFRVSLVDGSYPEYDRVIPADSFVKLDAEGEAQRREWAPVGINSKYLRDVGEVAKVLNAGLPKHERAAAGLAVRSYIGTNASAPQIFDFEACPGAIMIIMPMQVSNVMRPATAALLDPQIKGTLAALRAHRTRWLEAAEGGRNKMVKAEALAKAQSFELRINEILTRTGQAPALPAPATVEAAAITDETQPKPGEEQQPEPVEPQPEPDEGGEGAEEQREPERVAA